MTPRRPTPGQPFNPYGWFDGIWIPNWLYRRNEVSDSAKILYARMVRFTAKGGECRPSQEYLARDLNRSDRHVRRLLEELTNAALIASVRRGSMKSNVYVFLWHDWMEDEGDWYPHDDLAGPEGSDRTDLSCHDRTGLSSHDRTDLSGPLPYEQERVTKGERSRAPRRDRAGIRPVSPEAELPEDDASTHRRRPRRGRDDSTPSSPEPRPGSGAGLAKHFRRLAIKTWGFEVMGPSPFNDRALASELLGWQRDGVTEEEIRSMIELFCTEPLPEGKPPWVSLLAARSRLAKHVKKSKIDYDQYDVDY